MQSAKVFSTRIPVEVADAIDRVAKDRGRHRGAVVREALEYYLEEWAQYCVALDRLQDPRDDVMNEADFLAELGWNI
jgi:predicted DNA-binding protein